MESVNRIGVTKVYEPEEGHNVDIVLVHGLFGHAENTWSADVKHDRDTSEPPRKRMKETNERNTRRVFWPRDLLPKKFPKARIMTWGYDVSINNFLSASSKSSIYHHSESLLGDLAAVRNKSPEKDTPIIFIAHSLGGIVVKDALQLSATKTSYLSEIAAATTGVMFLGTPHHGSKVASLGKQAFNILKVFLQDANAKVLQGLEINSEILERVTQGFSQLLATSRIKVHSFREELSINGIMIVDSFSSTIGCSNETRGTLHANHREMAKLTAEDDVKFQRVGAVLERWMSPESKETPWSEDMRYRVLTALPYDDDYNKQYEACLQSLNSYDARRRLMEVEPVYGKTFLWMFKPELGFQDWLRGNFTENTYWIRGKPGSGKSTAMKFAINHPSTEVLLRQHHPDPWVVLGYFFHDRGSAIQKTIRGFLGEVLYGLLRERKDLFQFVRPTYSRLVEYPPRSSNGPNADIWRHRVLEEALVSTCTDQQEGLNLCVFVDALDEHEGDHKKLIAMLNNLRKLTSNKRFRFRLCVAGRPEGIFKSAFHSCPGFAIQDYTTSDIQLYVEGRLRHELQAGLPPEVELQLSELTADVIFRSQGVFLWVRLVVDEMIEGLCEGDTIDELKSLLSTIPSELGELYSRALCRTSRKSAQMSSKNRLELYIMVQLIAHSTTPFELAVFLSAADYLVTGQTSSLALEGLSVDQMERRLYSRSLGFLEATKVTSQDPNIYQNTRGRVLMISPVQFIHQTVKEYMSTGEGYKRIREGLERRDLESGIRLMLRYVAGLVENRYSNPGSKVFAAARGAQVVEVAHDYEKEHREPASELLGPALLRLEEKDRHDFLAAVFHKGFFPDLVPNPLETLERRSAIQLLKFYALYGLYLSVRHQVSSLTSEFIEEDFRALVVCVALSKTFLGDRLSEMNRLWTIRKLNASSLYLLDEKLYQETKELLLHPVKGSKTDWLDHLIGGIRRDPIGFRDGILDEDITNLIRSFEAPNWSNLPTAKRADRVEAKDEGPI